MPVSEYRSLAWVWYVAPALFRWDKGNHAVFSQLLAVPVPVS